MTLGNFSLLLMFTGLLAAQPPAPGRRPGPPPMGPESVGRKLTQVRPTDAVTKRILALAKMYLDRNEAEKNKSAFLANRHLAAADALVHAAEHQQHILEKSGPPPPDGTEVARHLDRVYFRLQQADYFAKQSGDANAREISSFARQYYQNALHAAQIPDLRMADECAKSAEDLMRALENLAQATVSFPSAPVPPHGKR